MWPSESVACLVQVQSSAGGQLAAGPSFIGRSVSSSSSELAATLAAISRPPSLACALCSGRHAGMCAAPGSLPRVRVRVLCSAHATTDTFDLSCRSRRLVRACMWNMWCLDRASLCAVCRYSLYEV